MKIVIDHVIDSKSGAKIGEVLINTDGPVPMHPTAGRQAVDWNEWLTAMNSNPAARTAGGWDEVPKIAGSTHPTRWHQLVAVANAPDAEPAIAALGLTAT